jgi:hypothetical protein
MDRALRTLLPIGFFCLFFLSRTEPKCEMLARQVNQRGRHARHANGQPCALRRVMDKVIALAFMPPNEISKTCNRILYMYLIIIKVKYLCSEVFLLLILSDPAFFCQAGF